MSGLLALLDDVAAIAKVAAASLDDVASQAAKAGAKAAGALIDDAAVTPKYVQGFSAERELPIIWKIAKGSLKNKLLLLLPAGLALSAFAPWAIAPLLMLGGSYLCFEGAEKVMHWLRPPAHGPEGAAPVANPAHLEEQKVAGAIKTDFILSAEIMTIALAAIPGGSFWFQAATLAMVGVGITFLVYGSVALIVKADDLGLLMANKGRLRPTRWLGRTIVRAMPRFMSALMVMGTAAMLWVGGSIVIHGLDVLGLPQLGRLVDEAMEFVEHLGSGAPRRWLDWVVKAVLDGLFGLALGMVLIPVSKFLIEPLMRALRGMGGKTG
jgi:uncharacterized protein